MEVNRQEKDWAVHLFKDGDVPGLNTNSMWSFIDYLTVSRMPSSA
ncbi:Ribonucleotide reductase of class Ia (aerobic), beta subunit [Leuconostoc mesenteroides subsp. cremoris T26]|nr:Ribonucleotide reductase of class Ia (aerobic), beta subunit [Leuconostoc mesenteroides subsp. cremoris T26]